VIWRVECSYVGIRATRNSDWSAGRGLLPIWVEVCRSLHRPLTKSLYYTVQNSELHVSRLWDFVWLALSSPAPRERPARSVRPSHRPIQEVVSLVTRAPPTFSPARSSLKVSRSDPQRPSAHVSGCSMPQRPRIPPNPIFFFLSGNS
jgi:hypothetical protein